MVEIKEKVKKTTSKAKNAEDKLETLKGDVVQFTFPMGELEIAVLDSSVLNSKEAKNKLYLAKLVEKDTYTELQALTEEEYDKAYNEYVEILKMFKKVGK